MPARADYTVTLDTTTDPRLQTQQGLVTRLGELLEQLVASGENFPRHIDVALIFSDAGQADDLEAKIQKLNKVIQPKGFMDRIAHSAFRSMSGVQGDLRPLETSRDGGAVRLSLDLSGISAADVQRFAEFLSKNAHRLS